MTAVAPALVTVIVVADVAFKGISFIFRLEVNIAHMFCRHCNAVTEHVFIQQHTFQRRFGTDANDVASRTLKAYCCLRGVFRHHVRACVIEDGLMMVAEFRRTRACMRGRFRPIWSRRRFPLSRKARPSPRSLGHCCLQCCFPLHHRHHHYWPAVRAATILIVLSI